MFKLIFEYIFLDNDLMKNYTIINESIFNCIWKIFLIIN